MTHSKVVVGNLKNAPDYTSGVAKVYVTNQWRQALVNSGAGNLQDGSAHTVRVSHCEWRFGVFTSLGLTQRPPPSLKPWFFSSERARNRKFNY